MSLTTHEETAERLLARLDRPLTPEVVAEYAARGTAGMIRQSTIHQKEENIGSGRMQLDYIHRVAAGYGIQPDQVRVFDARGETGSDRRRRHQFDRLLRLIDAGKVGLVIFFDHNRIARNNEDGGRLTNVCRRRDTLVHVNGQVYDLRRFTDRGALALFTASNTMMSEGHISYLQRAKLDLAIKRELRIPLPTGLVWADPTDQNYRERLERAGHLHWLAHVPERHKVSSMRDQRRLYVLPYPDATVIRSCELRLSWLLRHRSLAAVNRLIHAGADGYPHPGKIPHQNKKFRYRPDMRLTWVTSTTNILARWFRSPALFGIYATYREHFARGGSTRSAPGARDRAGFAREFHRQQPLLPTVAELLDLDCVSTEDVPNA